MEDYRKRFQELLRRLFQFDSADLDFGIYRIMNYKRSLIEKFIEKDLIKAVSAELDTGALAEQCEVAKQLQEVAEQIRENLGEDSIDGDGNLEPRHRETRVGKKYLDLQVKARGAHARPALDAAVFNHLYSFFSRYYDAGDFMSKRRYSKREKYAVPYNGEEVYLHWANKDQYYIKTGEYFTDYRFQAPNGVAVHFRLQAAQVEQDNVKGDKRFFIPLTKTAAFEAKEVVIPFEYRALSEQEDVRYGQRNQQHAIIAEALEAIPGHFAKEGASLAALMAERRKNADGQPVSYLEHHLRQYTRRNTSDFFIHKDLKGFLERELDFYLKNEVLNLDELEASGEAHAEGWFQLLRAIKSIGSKIIAFLAQIEDFQKRLFEKRKFILETNYCITVGNTPEDFYAEIAACESQWQEWKELFHIDEFPADLFSGDLKTPEGRHTFLKAYPTLVIDTKHFDRDFVDRFLASFDNLDDMTHGLVIHSENWQALNLLEERYREQVKCIYIDPPYNTGTDGFIYRDSYQHSCWITMMRDRLHYGSRLLSPQSIHLVSIGEDEFDQLSALLTTTFAKSLIPFVWKSRAKPTNAGDAIYRPQIVAEFVLANLSSGVIFHPIPSGEGRIYPHEDGHGHYRMTTILTSNRGRYRRETMRFEIADYAPPADKRWKAGEEEIRSLYEAHRVGFGEDGEPHRKMYEGDEEDLHVPLWTYLPEDMTGTAESGKADLSALLGKEHGLDSVKPKELIKIFLSAAVPGGPVLDYFAGSGTTGHAIIEMNREDGCAREFLLVEQAEYFDLLLLPRIKKVTFAPEWKDGKPKRMATQEEAERSPRIVKYIRLESYEDALNSIEFDDAAGQQALKFEDYLLKYMLEWETKDSETLLTVKKLCSPFDYRLRVVQDGQTGEKPVDLPETFNYLLGLHVKTRKVCHDKDRRYLVYRGTVDSRQVAVIWRTTAGWSKKDFERDKKFVAEQKLTEGADEVFVNSGSVIPGARSLDPVFKARMFVQVAASGGN